MATLDALFPGLAARLIGRFGATAVLEIVTKTEDLASGKVSESMATASLKISPPEPLSIGLIDGTLVQAGDMTTVVAAQDLGTSPVANRDRLAFDGESWQIVAIDPIYSGDEAAAFRLQLRR